MSRIARRGFLRNILWGGIFALSRPGRVRTATLHSDRPDLRYLTDREYHLINRIAREVIPSEPVLSGQVNIALNIDRFIHKNPSEDLDSMLQYLRLISLAEPFVPLIRPFVPGIKQDIMSLKKVICFVGYYSDANGEADLPPAERIIWPEIGYTGPKPDHWFPPDSEPQIEPASLEDRIGRVL
jgi:hypothetical protein